MRQLGRRHPPVQNPAGVLRLTFDERQRARSRLQTDAGETVGVFIERGGSLKHGDHLACQDGVVFVVFAKPERLSVLRAHGAAELARATYHLGNRHVRLEVGDDYAAYQTDHVQDEMVTKMGFQIEHDDRPFEPEPGAYHGAHTHSLAPGQGAAEHQILLGFGGEGRSDFPEFPL